MKISPTLFSMIAMTLAVMSCTQPPQSTNPASTPKKEEAKAPEKKRLRQSEQGKVSSISLTKLFALQQNGSVLIYDARPSVLYREGHLPGAISMPKSICVDVINVREPELKAAKAAGKQIVIYCSGMLCSDSRTVARHLASSGHSSSVFSGGWDEWKSAGLPTEP